MATYKGAQSSRAKQASNDCGNAFHDANEVVVTANLTTADEIVLMEIPAGVELTQLQLRAGDLDTGTTLTMNIGYRSLHPDQNEAAALTYFGSALTSFQAAQASWVDYVFAPKRFSEPVAIVARPAANGTGISGTPLIFTRATGVIRGVV